MSVTEVKSKFEAGKKAVEDCQRLILGLIKKKDELLEEMSVLKNSVGRSETNEAAAFDKFVLGKITQKELDLEKIECRKAKTKYEDSSKMLESLSRGIKKTESDLQRVNAESALRKRQYWQSIADEIKTAIPSEVFESVRRLQVIGSHCGQTRQFLLDSLFQNPTHDDVQKIQRILREEHNID